MTPGLMTGVPTQRRIGIDEADDLDAELVPALVELAREADRGRRWCRRAAAVRAGPRCRLSHSNARRQPMTSVITSNAAIMNTPRPMISAGNQK